MKLHRAAQRMSDAYERSQGSVAAIVGREDLHLLLQSVRRWEAIFQIIAYNVPLLEPPAESAIVLRADYRLAMARNLAVDALTGNRSHVPA